MIRVFGGPGVHFLMAATRRRCRRSGARRGGNPLCDVSGLPPLRASVLMRFDGERARAARPAGCAPPRARGRHSGLRTTTQAFGLMAIRRARRIGSRQLSAQSKLHRARQATPLQKCPALGIAGENLRRSFLHFYRAFENYVIYQVSRMLCHALRRLLTVCRFVAELARRRFAFADLGVERRLAAARPSARRRGSARIRRRAAKDRRRIEPQSNPGCAALRARKAAGGTARNGSLPETRRCIVKYGGAGARACRRGRGFARARRGTRARARTCRPSTRSRQRPRPAATGQPTS